MKASKQVGISDFGMPLGLKLDPENRWVKKAETIPWEKIEERYAALFESEKGNAAKPLRLALGALIIQTERRDFGRGNAAANPGDALSSILLRDAWLPGCAAL